MKWTTTTIIRAIIITAAGEPSRETTVVQVYTKRARKSNGEKREIMRVMTARKTIVTSGASALHGASARLGTFLAANKTERKNSTKRIRKLYLITVLERVNQSTSKGSHISLLMKKLSAYLNSGAVPIVN